ncbi:MAG: SIMPL domain-containing protein [Rubrivivax sp.]
MRFVIPAVLALAGAAAAAQTLPPPQNVVSLTSSATVEVTKDLLTVVFATTREGSDANAVQNQLKQAVDAALAELRKAAKPGQIEVQTGNFSLYPRYAPKGGINGWQGSAEVVVEGRDIAGIAALTGRVQTLTIARVAFGLSREAREKVDADVTGQAITKFRAKADGVSKQFGFGGYTIREVSVQSNEPPQGQPMYRMQAARAGADEAALPVEAGKASVTASVSGSVQMK